MEVLKLPELIESQAKWGLSTASLTVKTLRAQIRARRKNKEPHSDLLQALYGAAVAADFVKALEFEYLPPHYMARFVAALKRAASMESEIEALSQELEKCCAKRGK